MEEQLYSIPNVPHATTPVGSHSSHFQSLLSDDSFQIFYHAPVLVLISGNASSQWMVEDCALAAQNLMLAAYAEGLGTCWIGAFDPAAAREILGLPDGVEIVGMTPLGFPDVETNPRVRSRRPLGETVMKERWG